MTPYRTPPTPPHLCTPLRDRARDREHGYGHGHGLVLAGTPLKTKTKTYSPASPFTRLAGALGVRDVNAHVYTPVRSGSRDNSKAPENTKVGHAEVDSVVKCARTPLTVPREIPHGPLLGPTTHGLVSPSPLAYPDDLFSPPRRPSASASAVGAQAYGSVQRKTMCRPSRPAALTLSLNVPPGALEAAENVRTPITPTGMGPLGAGTRGGKGTDAGEGKNKGGLGALGGLEEGMRALGIGYGLGLGLGRGWGGAGEGGAGSGAGQGEGYHYAALGEDSENEHDTEDEEEEDDAMAGYGYRSTRTGGGDHSRDDGADSYLLGAPLMPSAERLEALLMPEVEWEAYEFGW